MKVDLNELQRVFDYLAKINQTPIEDIEWVRDGELVPVDKEDIDNWNFIGLNNSSFPKVHEI